MLISIHISSVALIDDLKIDFQPGLNVLSGETGSGKSLILYALRLLSGEKPLPDSVRRGADRAIIEGLFDISKNDSLRSLITGAGLDASGDEILIRREFAANGKGKVFVNGQLSTVASLKGFRTSLIDIHGQGDQQDLLDPKVQLNVFDDFAGAQLQRNIMESKRDDMLRIRKELSKLDRDKARQAQVLDVIDFQIQEISQGAVSLSEDRELEEERQILLNSEKLAALSSEAYTIAFDSEFSVHGQLVRLQKKLRELAQIDSVFVSYMEQIELARIVLGDLGVFLGGYNSNIQSLPERLFYIDRRLQELSRLKQKYGGTIESVLEALTDLSTRRERISSNRLYTQELQEELRLVTKQYISEVKRLRNVREARVADFEKLIREEFEKVSNGPTQFAIQFKTVPLLDEDDERANDWGAASSDIENWQLRRNDADEAEFYFSANSGEALRPLRDIVSGGELSRLMLAIKANVSLSSPPRTLIFDEVDSGVGGGIADAVGRRLKRLASNNQILCITHQVQLARYADLHLLVYKEVKGKRTRTEVKRLNLSERIEELARMIGGAQVNETARQHAEKLLEMNADERVDIL